VAAARTDRRVLISGAGIAGLTLAVLLKQRGFELLVVERDAGVRAQGYMMDFFGSGRVLQTERRPTSAPTLPLLSKAGY